MMKPRGFSDMSNNRNNFPNICRAGSVALLAGCLWFSAVPTTLAQSAQGSQQAAQVEADRLAHIHRQRHRSCGF